MDSYNRRVPLVYIYCRILTTGKGRCPFQLITDNSFSFYREEIFISAYNGQLYSTRTTGLYLLQDFNDGRDMMSKRLSIILHNGHVVVKKYYMLCQLSYQAVKIIAFGIRTRDLTFWQNQVSNPAAEFRNLKIPLFRCKMCKDERVRAWFCLIQDALPTELTLDRYTFESVVNLLGCCIFVVYFIAKVRISAYCPLSTH